MSLDGLKVSSSSPQPVECRSVGQMTKITTGTDTQPMNCLSALVVATMRDAGKRGALEKAAGDSLNETLEIKQLDVCCEDSIRECVNSLPDRRVDVLGVSPLIRKAIFKRSPDKPALYEHAIFCCCSE